MLSRQRSPNRRLFFKRNTRCSRFMAVRYAKVRFEDSNGASSLFLSTSGKGTYEVWGFQGVFSLIHWAALNPDIANTIHALIIHNVIQPEWHHIETFFRASYHLGPPLKFLTHVTITTRTGPEMSSNSLSPPKSPTRNSNSSGVNGVKKRNHPFIISSLFDVFENVGPEVSGMYGLRHSHTTIVTRATSGDSVEWVVKCVAYGGTDIILDVDGVYYLKGRLLALNAKETPKFYYEPDFQLLANTSENLPCNLANGVSVTGLGIIISRVTEALEVGRENVTLIIRHSDYNPDIQNQSVFEVEYKSMWSRLMEKLQPLMMVGREVMVTGHILTGISVTSGSETSSPPMPSGSTSNLTTPRGRVRAKMIFTERETPQESPSTSTSNDTCIPEQELSGGKGKGKAVAKPLSSRSPGKRGRGPASDNES
ncbi:hypothetical protein DFH28DRAFT_1123666 [Melampsora americana]|nr:hypothetical protein DFH28DRAFT_1137587 [Melampsora americana]KAH9818491.1 hypothetical protein DFH28DRAFT_1123666 [Melampsora americana]